MRKKIFSTLIASIMVCLCLGCGGKKGPDGEWTHTKTILDDGSVTEGDELEPETVVVNGDTAHYSCDSSILGKPIEFDLSIKENDDGTYNFYLIGSNDTITDIAFMENVEVKGNTMSHTIDGVKFEYTKN